MLVAVILGNRLRDDGSITELMEKRLQIALEIEDKFSPAKIIVSGGIANRAAVVSESDKMYDYLTANGVSADKIVKENQSLTTKQNAEFSVPIAVQLGATEILMCTSIEHMSRSYLNPIRLFQKQLDKFPNVKLQVYAK